MPIYKVMPKKSPDGQPLTRLVKAPRIAAVERHVLADFDIAAATVDEAVELGAQGVKVEDAAL